MTEKDVKENLAKARKEAVAEQQKEMNANWAKLSPESRIQLVLLSRELVKQEQKAARKAKLMADLNKLNKEGLAVALEWSETLRLDPRYR